MKNYPNLGSISKPTLSKCLKYDYGMSYKKVWRVNNSILSQDRKELTMDSIAILGTLEERGVEIVFIDEFTASGKSYKPYGWSSIKNKGWKLTPNDQFSMGFIMSLSAKWTYGIMGVKGTTDSSVFVTYLNDLVRHMESKANSSEMDYVLCWDNASYHKTEHATDFLK